MLRIEQVHHPIDIVDEIAELQRHLPHVGLEERGKEPGEHGESRGIGPTRLISRQIELAAELNRKGR